MPYCRTPIFSNKTSKHDFLHWSTPHNENIKCQKSALLSIYRSEIWKQHQIVWMLSSYMTNLKLSKFDTISFTENSICGFKFDPEYKQRRQKKQANNVGILKQLVHPVECLDSALSMIVNHSIWSANTQTKALFSTDWKRDAEHHFEQTLCCSVRKNKILQV